MPLLTINVILGFLVLKGVLIYQQKLYGVFSHLRIRTFESMSASRISGKRSLLIASYFHLNLSNRGLTVSTGISQPVQSLNDAAPW